MRPIGCDGDITSIIKENRLSLAHIGLTERQFNNLLVFFKKEYEKVKKKRENIKKAGRKSKLSTIEKKLFFILYYMKTYPTYDMLSGIFGLHRSNACRNVFFLMEILKNTLKRAGILPVRSIKSKKDFQKIFKKIKFIIVDGTERRRRRPKNKVKQRIFYSGKKKYHSLKNLCISEKNKYILFVSETYPGKEHDKTIFINEKLYKRLPDKIKKYMDLAFYGIEKEAIKNILMPKKKPKGKELTVIDKKNNKIISQTRVLIENAFAGVKRLRIVYDVFRNIKEDFADNVFWISCGLWNFYLCSR